MNRWEGLEEFVAVAETGGFTAAAQRLGMSSSHVSRQVARLEARMQTRLFHRSTRLVRLTEAGQTFLQHCRPLQDGYDEALRTVQDLGESPKGLLRITSGTESVEVDGNLRVRFDTKALDAIGVEPKGVCLAIGGGNHVQIWAPERWVAVESGLPSLPGGGA